MPAACSWARKGLGPLGLMESDPLLIQAEQKLIDQADELVVLAEFVEIQAALEPDPVRPGADSTVITDDGIEDREAKMLESAGVTLIIAREGKAKAEDASLQA